MNRQKQDNARSNLGDFIGFSSQFRVTFLQNQHAQTMKTTIKLGCEALINSLISYFLNIVGLKALASNTH